MSTATSKAKRTVTAELQRLEAENDRAREVSQAAHAKFAEYERQQRARFQPVDENPNGPEYEAARAAFQETSERLLRFRTANALALLDEAAPDRAQAGDAVTAALANLAAACDAYHAQSERVRAVVLTTPGLNGQDVLLDDRVGALAKLAQTELRRVEREPIAPPMSNALESSWPTRTPNADGTGFVGTGRG